MRPEFNLPLRAVATQPHAGNCPQAASLLQVAAGNVIVEAVKRAEDGNGMIVRLYEATQAGTRTIVSLHFPVQSVAETNLLEEDGRPLALQNGALALEFRPFEIKTLMVNP